MKAKIRAIARQGVLDFLGDFARPSKGIHLLNSHILTLDRELDSNIFDDQLKMLTRKSTIIPFAEATELIERKNRVNGSLIAFSYDDGFEECYSHIAPVLENYNGYACFFINPNFASGSNEYITSFLKNKVHIPSYKKPMSWNQISELNNRGHIIGAHTMDHERMSNVSDIQEKIYQIGECKREIMNRLGGACDYFAFTYGHCEQDFNIVDIEIAESYYKYIYSASNWQNYFSYNDRVLNRRHCEPYWKAKHINFFLSRKISY